MSKRNIESLRGHLFKVLESLDDDTKPPDMERQRAVCETAQTLINSLKVEVELHAILRGAIDVPFVESQSNERSNSEDPTKGASHREATTLRSGPSADHVWRKPSRRAARAGVEEDTGRHPATPNPCGLGCHQRVCRRRSERTSLYAQGRSDAVDHQSVTGVIHHAAGVHPCATAADAVRSIDAARPGEVVHVLGGHDAIELTASFARGAEGPFPELARRQLVQKGIAFILDGEVAKSRSAIPRRCVATVAASSFRTAGAPARRSMRGESSNPFRSSKAADGVRLYRDANRSTSGRLFCCKGATSALRSGKTSQPRSSFGLGSRINIKRR